MPDPTVDELRRGVLAVSVLREIDLVPTDDGVLLTGAELVEVGWADCARAVGRTDPQSDLGHELLERWLLLARWVTAPADEQVRPLGLPRGHVLHPGSDWAYEKVLGGALDLGLGVAGIDSEDPDRVLALPVGLPVTRQQTLTWRASARTELDRLGQVAADRRRRAGDAEPLRPVGGLDVVTLLGSRALRTALAGDEGGMCAAAVPMRTRGWTDLRRIDPAFCVAAAAATDDADRGFDRPLLITAEEIQVARAGGRPTVIELRDPAPATPWQKRSVRYR